MPGIPLAAQGNIHSGNSDQMRHNNPEAALSPEEERGSEEGLSVYCEPLEVYNILQRRAKKNPLFLRRCLSYQLEAKHSKRLQMTISLSGVPMDGLQVHPFFPVYVVLATRVDDTHDAEYPALYTYTKICTLKASSLFERKMSEVSFILPEMNKLAEEAISRCLLFISCAETNSFSRSSTSVESSEAMLYSSINNRKHCLWGKIPLESLYLSWERSLNLKLEGKAEMTLPLHLSYSIFKCAFCKGDGQISIQPSFGANNPASMMQVQVAISVQELGTKEKSSCNLYAYNSVAGTSSHVTRLKSGDVIFNYKYCDNKLQKTEVTEDFICPFCLVGCASFEGLICHLSSSHDLFRYEFWTTEEFQAVNVSMKCDSWKPQMIGCGIDPKLQTFSHGKRRRRRGNSKIPFQGFKDVYVPAAFASNMLGETSEILDKADDAQSSKDDMARSSSVNGSHNSLADADAVRSGGNLAPPHMLQFAKTRKLSIEHSDHRNRALLERRHFFHSHRAQPMALEQVFSDHDSEDEVDDDVADLEDRRMLDDFIDVSKDEKHLMHLWNSFVRKQRVLADSHIPWACEGFSRLHGADFANSPVLVWCWRLFMIKLWNHGLLDARTMNKCYLILDQSQSEETTHLLREDDEAA